MTSRVTIGDSFHLSHYEYEGEDFTDLVEIEFQGWDADVTKEKSIAIIKLLTRAYNLNLEDME